MMCKVWWSQVEEQRKATSSNFGPISIHGAFRTNSFAVDHSKTRVSLLDSLGDQPSKNGGNLDFPQTVPSTEKQFAQKLRTEQPGIEPASPPRLPTNFTDMPNIQLTKCDTAMVKKQSSAAVSCRTDARLQKLHFPKSCIPTCKV